MTRSTHRDDADDSDSVVVITDLDPITPADRERWLAHAADLLRPYLDSAGCLVPAKLRVSCGFPSSGGTGRVKRSLGECWDPACSADHTTEVLVSPTIEERETVLAVLIHELIHAALGYDEGHGKAFKQAAKTLGLIGKASATEPGPDFLRTYSAIFQALGPYPHHRIDPLAILKEKKQTTRMVKVECVKPGCGWGFRTTRKQITRGLPPCPVKGCGGVLEPDLPVEDDGSDDDGAPSTSGDGDGSSACTRDVERGHFPE